MKRSFLFLIVLSWCTLLFAQDTNSIVISQKGSLGFCDVGTIKAVGLNKSWENMAYRMQSREYRFFRERLKENGKKVHIWLKNVIVNKTTGSTTPIEGEVVSSIVHVEGTKDKISDITVIYYNPGKELNTCIDEGIKGEGFKMDSQDGLRSNYSCSGVFLEKNVSANGKTLFLTMKNYNIEQEQKIQAFTNKMQDPILHASEYLNGKTPNNPTLSINDLFKIFEGNTLETANVVFKSKGYAYHGTEYGNNYWAKNGTLDKGLHLVQSYKDLSIMSHVEAEFHKGKTFSVGLDYYNNDLLCAWFVTKIEEMGYHAKYKLAYPPGGGIAYFFTKEGSDCYFQVYSMRPHGNARVPQGTIQYGVMLMSKGHFQELMNRGKVVDKDEQVERHNW